MFSDSLRFSSGVVMQVYTTQMVWRRREGITRATVGYITHDRDCDNRDAGRPDQGQYTAAPAAAPELEHRAFGLAAQGALAGRRYSLGVRREGVARAEFLLPPRRTGLAGPLRGNSPHVQRADRTAMADAREGAARAACALISGRLVLSAGRLRHWRHGIIKPRECGFVR